VEDSRDFAETLRKASAMLAQAAEAAEVGDMQLAADLRRKAHASLSPADATRHRRRSSTGPAQRDLIVQALGELGVPTPTGLLAGFVRARFGVSVDSRQLASTRRDEARSYSRGPARRPAWVVPALEARRFLPMRGKLTLSSWPLARRIVGPLSERADHLRLVDTLAKRLGWLQDRDPSGADHLRPFVVRLAGSVPGALADGGDPDPSRIGEAVRAELELIEAGDQEERNLAAERAERQLDEHQRVWGVEPPRAISGAMG
jgi:hypothetical protein